MSMSIHPSPAVKPSFQGGLDLLGPAGSLQMGLSLEYPSGRAGPSELSVRGVEQVSSSSTVTGADILLPPMLAVAPDQQLAPRQPPPLSAVMAATTSLTTNKGVVVVGVIHVLGFLIRY